MASCTAAPASEALTCDARFSQALHKHPVRTQPAARVFYARLGGATGVAACSGYPATAAGSSPSDAAKLRWTGRRPPHGHAFFARWTRSRRRRTPICVAGPLMSPFPSSSTRRSVRDLRRGDAVLGAAAPEGAALAVLVHFVDTAADPAWTRREPGGGMVHTRSSSMAWSSAASSTVDPGLFPRHEVLRSGGLRVQDLGEDASGA